MLLSYIVVLLNICTHFRISCIFQAIDQGKITPTTLPQLLSELVERWGLLRKHLEDTSRAKEYRYVIEEVSSFVLFSNFVLLFQVSYTSLIF